MNESSVIVICVQAKQQFEKLILGHYEKNI